MHRNYLTIQLVTNCGDKDIDSYLTFVENALCGGVTSVQLREKCMARGRRLHFAQALHALLLQYDVPFIINDDVRLAKTIDAEGVHLGQTDGCPRDARRYLGPTKIIGWTVETSEQLEMANLLDCIDYVGCGSIFASKSKLDCAHLFGLDGLRRAVAHSTHPIIAIGGIDLRNARQVYQTGCAGVAVIAAIHDTTHPQDVVLQLLREKNAVSKNDQAIETADSKYFQLRDR